MSCPTEPAISNSVVSLGDVSSKQLLEITSQIEQMQMYQRTTSERVQALELDVQVLKGCDDIDKLAMVWTKINQNCEDIDKLANASIAKEKSESNLETHASNKFDAKIIWEQSHEHPLRYSVWEMAIVVNVGILSLSGRIQFLCAFLLNLFLQGVISATMIVSFGSSRIGIGTIDEWRRTVGHNYNMADYVKEQSLVSRICALDDTLGSYDFYLNALGNYESYVVGGMGEWLAAVVGIVWILTVTEDILACISFVDGVCSLPQARHTRVMSTWNPLDKIVTFEFVAMGTRNKIFLLFLSLLRMSMAALLLIPGSIWLATEYEIVNLLLNCCALGFVFELDEMCFDIVAPLDMKTLAENIRPLPKIRNERWNTLLLPKIPALVNGAVVFLYMLFVHILPTKQYLIDTHKSLCYGKRDFVYGLNVDTKLIFATQVRSADEGPTENREADVVRRLIESADFSSVKGALHMEDFATLRARAELSMRLFTEERMLRCADQIAAYPIAVRAAVQRYNANSSATTCAGLSASCFEIEQKLLRLVCPVTCGAASPRSGQFLNRREYGVKREMCFATQIYQDAFAEIPCTDPSPEALMTMPGWRRAWNLMVEYWGRFSALFRKCYQGVADSFFSKGCDALVLYDGANCMGFRSLELCTDSVDLIHLARFCPVACGCLGARSNHSACPPTCAQ